MARRDAEPGPDLDPLRGGLKHNPFAALKPRTSAITGDAGQQEPAPSADNEPSDGAAEKKSRAPRREARSTQPPPKASVPTLGAPHERVIVRRERKGRGGKAVTLAEGPGLASLDLTELARDAARALGTGARIENGALVVQGEQSERLIAWLRSRGCKSVIAGN